MMCLVIIHHPSGSKQKFVTSPTEKRICRAIVRDDEHRYQTMVDALAECYPKSVINSAAKIVQKECREVGKISSESLFKKKDHTDFLQFTWELLYEDIKRLCPGLIEIMSAVLCDNPTDMVKKLQIHLVLSVAVLLHGRNQQLSFIQYLIGIILSHGGCTLRTIERLCTFGLSVHPNTLQQKLKNWQVYLDAEIMNIRDVWSNDRDTVTKYQLVGDNWDRNILPSYRTSQQKTESIHVFNLVAVVDRIPPSVEMSTESFSATDIFDLTTFLPSIDEQHQLLNELTFIFASSLIENHPELAFLKSIYPSHLEHSKSQYAGIKTCQYPLGLFDCNETKTQEVIQLLKELSNKYLPLKDNEVVEPVFIGGDRLTDERFHCAQQAMSNAVTEKEKLQGFISKIEDFHRLMNFLEAIFKLTYSTTSGQEPGTAYYYRNLLNLRNVKGDVKNAYRAYKMMYYTILESLFMLFFLKKFNLESLESTIPFPENFETYNNDQKMAWINEICSDILKDKFFESSEDIFTELRKVFENPNHPENYWIANYENDRLKCHFCEKTYAFVGSLQYHEKKVHSVQVESIKKKVIGDKTLNGYLSMLFKLVLLHKNLDMAVDMADGERSVRSAKYELPLYCRTNKIKYVIGAVHLISLASGILPEDQKQRLVHNRFINLQGGKNNNMALDEYVELLNRETKTACSGHQTKESILHHSKEYPHLVNVTKHSDHVSGTRIRKGFHHLPSYKEDIKKVLCDLLKLDIFSDSSEVTLSSKKLCCEKNVLDNCSGLSALIYRHKPSRPFHRLRNPHM